MTNVNPLGSLCTVTRLSNSARFWAGRSEAKKISAAKSVKVRFMAPPSESTSFELKAAANWLSNGCQRLDVEDTKNGRVCLLLQDGKGDIVNGNSAGCLATQGAMMGVAMKDEISAMAVYYLRET